MAAKKVLLTGATSFTGHHIARAFRAAGYQVIATLTEKKSEPRDAVSAQRLERARVDHWIEEAAFGTPAFVDSIKLHRPQILINHGASIKGYRDPSFDYLKCVSTSLFEARTVMKTLRESGCKSFLHSGSIFEPDEGTLKAGTAGSSEAISIYGTSKNLVWQGLRFFAHEASLPISKIVIANPVGPFENPDRLIPIFVSEWKSGKVPVLKTPKLVRDNIPASWLANVYLEEAERALNSAHPESRVRRPRGYALSNERFLKLFVERFTDSKPGFECPVHIEEHPSTEPQERFNQEPCKELSQGTALDQFWSEWTQHLKGI